MDAQTMTADQAAQVLTERVFLGAFFNKLAACGAGPRTEQEAEQLWALGQQILQNQHAKTAADANVFSSLLDYTLSKYGAAQPQAEAPAIDESTRLEYFKAADNALTDPLTQIAADVQVTAQQAA